MDGNAHCRNVAGIDEPDGTERRPLRHVAAVEHEPGVRNVTVDERKVASSRHRRDAWKGSQARGCGIDEGEPLFWLVVGASRERDPQRQDPASLEAHVDVVEAHRACHDGCRTGDERNRQSHLSGHQETANPARAGSGPGRSALLLQDAAKVYPRATERRRQPEQQCRDDRRAQRKCHHPAVHCEFDPVRTLGLSERSGEQIDAPLSEEQTDQAARDGEHPALRHQLSHEPQAAGPDRGAQRHFALPCADICRRGFQQGWRTLRAARAPRP